MYISAKLLESNGTVTFSTSKKHESTPFYEKPYENPLLTYCPTSLDVKVSDLIQNSNSLTNEVLDNVTAAIQSTKNSAINRQILQQDPVFFPSHLENIINNETSYEDWVATSFDLGLINDWTKKRYFGKGDIEPGHQKQFIFNSTEQCVNLLPQSNQILLQYDLTKETTSLIICAKYLTVIGAILSDSVNSSIATTKDIGYLFERSSTNDDRYFIVIDPNSISKENRYYGTLTISLSINEDDFKMSIIAGSDGVAENRINNITETHLQKEPCSNYASYQCNNDLFKFHNFVPKSVSVPLEDSKMIKTSNNFDMVSGCWANVTPTDTKSIVENIKEIHENLNIFGYIDIHQYVLNGFEYVEDNTIPLGGILMGDENENILYSIDGFKPMSITEVDGSISLEHQLTTSDKKKPVLPQSTNTALYSRINTTTQGLQKVTLHTTSTMKMQSNVKPPCDC